MDGIKEGTLYKLIEIDGVRFEIYYGYEYEDERGRGWEPSLLYPDFIKEPRYTADGSPFANAYQEVCEHYERKTSSNDDDWCDLCKYFDKRDECIGICRCSARRVRKNE